MIKGINGYIDPINAIVELSEVLNQKKDKQTLKYSLKIIESIMKKKKSAELTKFAAEVTYLLSEEYMTANKKLALHFVRQSIKYYENCKINSLEDATPILSKFLPEYMHEGVAKNLLQTILHN